MNSQYLTVVLIAIAAIYGRGWVQLRKTLSDVLPSWRLGVFLGGVLCVWAAAASPLAVLDHRMLTAHMVQHLLLMTVAAPLILMGAPVITLMHGLPQGFAGRFLVPLLRRPAVHGFGRVITHPVFCWLASTGVVIAWHVPSLFMVGMRWHALEHMSFFAAGLLFWWPVIRPWPSLARWPEWSVPLYLFLATLPCDALSAFLTFCGRVVYSHYSSADELFGVSALGDQECAGALMWVWVTFVYLAPAVFVTIQMLSPQRRASNAEVI
jgi:cytochrome c oxidase assembly factor CtaG